MDLPNNGNSSHSNYSECYRQIYCVYRPIGFLVYSFMVLVTFFIVVLRYGFNLGWIAMQESVLYMHGLVFLLGAAYTLKEGGHVRIDIFYQKYSIKTKALVDVFGTLFLLIPVCVFIFIISWIM